MYKIFELISNEALQDILVSRAELIHLEYLLQKLTGYETAGEMEEFFFKITEDWRNNDLYDFVQDLWIPVIQNDKETITNMINARIERCHVEYERIVGVDKCEEVRLLLIEFFNEQANRLK